MSLMNKLVPNLKDAAEMALFRTILSDRDLTIGAIYDELSSNPETYLLESFREMTIGKFAEYVDEFDEEEEDEDEEGEDEEEEEEEEEEVGASDEKPKKKEAKKRKAPPPRAEKSASSGDDDKIDLTSPDARKTYEREVIRAMRALNAVDKESAVSSRSIREIAGGDSASARSILNGLIEEERAKYDGAAAGTKYWLIG